MKEKLKKKDEDPFGSGLNRLVTASLIFPGLFCIVVFLGLPCLSLVLLSFFQKGPYGTIEWTLTLDNFARLLGFNIFGWSPHFFKILGRSFIDGAITTIGCVIISYPLCFHIAARKSALARFVWLTLLMVPFCTNVVIRTYAWQLILDPGVLGRIPAALGLVEPGEALYPSAFAVYLGMISTFLPFMALPLYASVERLNWTLDQAAKDLYSSKRTRFLRTVLPQTVNGLYAGIIITLVPSMAMFVVTDILGGAKHVLIGNFIQQQFNTSRDWPFGAVLSLALMILTLFSVGLFRKSRFFRGVKLY